jgi:hypothetical protein
MKYNKSNEEIRRIKTKIDENIHYGYSLRNSNKIIKYYTRDCTFLYGGVTKDTVHARRAKHNDDEPDMFYDTGVKSICTISYDPPDINNTLIYDNLYIAVITECENYLINSLFDLHADKMWANRFNDDDTPTQTGGNGVHAEDFTEGMIYSFYIVYG